MNKLQDAIYYLILHEEYYGKLLLNMRREYTKRVPSLGVSVTDKINLYINEDYLKSVTFMQLVGTLKHECLHIIMGHIERNLELTGSNNVQAISNMAADCAINQIIPEIYNDQAFYEQLISPETLKSITQNPNILDKETFEYYYQFLKETSDKIKQQLQNLQSVDSHEMWEESDNAQLVKEIIKDVLERTASSCSPGNIPGEVTDAIRRLSKPTVNWKQQLRRFCHRLISVNKKQSRNKRNRRFGLRYPGRRKETTLTLAIATDVSGSVPIQAIEQFFGEIDNIYKYCNQIYLIEADAAVHQVIEYKPGIVKNINGRGGTLYQPALDKAKELDADGIIYFGDGECFDSLVDPKIPVIWAMIEGFKAPTENFGRLVEVKVS